MKYFAQYYSNKNYYLLIKLLEEIEDKSYADIFDDMTENLNSSFFIKISNAIGTDYIVSTVEDLFKWNQYLFHGLERSLQDIVFHTYCLYEEVILP